MDWYLRAEGAGEERVNSYCKQDGEYIGKPLYKKVHVCSHFPSCSLTLDSHPDRRPGQVCAARANADLHRFVPFVVPRLPSLTLQSLSLLLC